MLLKKLNSALIFSNLITAEPLPRPNDYTNGPYSIKVVNAIQLCPITSCNSDEICIEPEDFSHGEGICVGCPKDKVKKPGENECVDDPCLTSCNLDSEICHRSNSKLNLETYCKCKPGYGKPRDSENCQLIPDLLELCNTNNGDCPENNFCLSKGSKKDPFSVQCVPMCDFKNGRFNLCREESETCGWNVPVPYKRNDFTTIGSLRCDCKPGFAKKNPETDLHCEPIPLDPCASESVQCEMFEKPVPIGPEDPFGCKCQDPCEDESINTCDEELEVCNYMFGELTCLCKDKSHRRINGKCRGPPENICQDADMPVDCPVGTKCYPDPLDPFAYQCADPCTVKIEGENTCDPQTETCAFYPGADQVTCTCKPGHKKNPSNNDKCQLLLLAGQTPCTIEENKNKCKSENKRCYLSESNPDFDFECHDPCVKDNLCQGENHQNQVCTFDANIGHSGQHLCSCDKDNGFVENVSNGKCETPLTDVCLNSTCPKNLKCYPKATNPNFEHICQDPCIREDLCPGINEKCVYDRDNISASENHVQCSCADGFLRHSDSGRCQRPPDDVCAQVICPENNQKCYTDPNNKFNHICKNPCDVVSENLCSGEFEKCVNYNQKTGKHTCSCVDDYVRHPEYDTCVVPPTVEEICGKDDEKNLCSSDNQECYQSEEDPFSHVCLDPCDIPTENKCRSFANQECVYSKSQNGMECLCKDNMILNEATKQCQMPPTIAALCKNNDCNSNEVCGPDPSHPLKYLCTDPCLNQCNSDEVCKYEFGMVTCNCPEGMSHNNLGFCAIPPEDPCIDENGESIALTRCYHDEACVKDASNPFNHLCVNLCQSETNPCEFPGQICKMGFHEKTCHCPKGEKLIDQRCQGPPEDVCALENNCQDHEKCTADTRNPWQSTCFDPCLGMTCLGDHQVCSFSNSSGEKAKCFCEKGYKAQITSNTGDPNEIAEIGVQNFECVRDKRDTNTNTNSGSDGNDGSNIDASNTNNSKTGFLKKFNTGSKAFVSVMIICVVVALILASLVVVQFLQKRRKQEGKRNYRTDDDLDGAYATWNQKRNKNKQDDSSGRPSTIAAGTSAYRPGEAFQPIIDDKHETTPFVSDVAADVAQDFADEFSDDDSLHQNQS